MSQEDLTRELNKLKIDKSRRRAPSRMGKLALWAVVILLAAGSFAFYQKNNSAIPVKTVTVVEEADPNQPVAVLTAGGYVIPRKNIEVSSKIIGRVVEMNVERGDQVREGDVMIRLEDDEYQAQVAAAESRLASIQAKLAELLAGSRPQEIQAAEATVATAEATMKGAKQDLDRLEPLGREGVVSQQELDKTRTGHNVAMSQVKEAREKARLVREGPRKEEIDAVQAQKREAEANLKYAQEQMDNTIIRAPISGTILEKLADLGELVTNQNFGGTRGAKSSVVAMADLKDLQVEIDMNENDIGRIRMGQKTEIRLDSHPDKAFSGKVDEISPVADRQKATVQVKVKVNEPDENVRPDVNARVTFLKDPASTPGQPATAGVWITEKAVLKDGEQQYVYVMQGGFADRREIKVSDKGEKGLRVIQGLKDGELLILEPLAKLAEGAKVELQKDEQ